MLKTRMDHLALLAPDDGGGSGGTLLTDGKPDAQATLPGAQPANALPPANNPATGEGDVPGWVSALTSDLRTNPVVLGHKKPTDFVKAALEWKGKADSVVAKPGEGATPEEVAAYRKAMGIPAKAEEYELPENNLASKEFKAEQIELYMQQGLTKDQAKAVYEKTVASIGKGAEIIRTANANARAEAEATLRQELGGNYESTLNAARNGLRRFASDNLTKYLNDTGLGNHPELVKFLAAVQNQIGGDSLLGGSGRQEPTVPEVQKRFPNSPTMWSRS